MTHKKPNWNNNPSVIKGARRLIYLKGYPTKLHKFVGEHKTEVAVTFAAALGATVISLVSYDSPDVPAVFRAKIPPIESVSKPGIEEKVEDVKKYEKEEPQAVQYESKLEEDVMNNVKLILDSRGQARDYFKDIQKAFSNLSVFDDYITKAAEEHGVNKGLVYAISATESEGNILAHSKKGAAGPMQLMPRTAKALGLDINNFIDERLDPEKAISAGVKYYNKWMSSFKKEAHIGLMAYNMGPTAQRKFTRLHGREWEDLKDHIPKETKNYVIKALSRLYLIYHAKDLGLEIEPQELFSNRIRNTRVVNIHKGENISQISRRYGTTLDEIKYLNPKLKDLNKVQAGYKIRLPIKVQKTSSAHFKVAA